jgi:hypothetical protein
MTLGLTLLVPKTLYSTAGSLYIINYKLYSLTYISSLKSRPLADASKIKYVSESHPMQ